VVESCGRVGLTSGYSVVKTILRPHFLYTVNGQYKYLAKRAFMYNLHTLHVKLRIEHFSQKPKFSGMEIF
jgi:hypothetical protein